MLEQLDLSTVERQYVDRRLLTQLTRLDGRSNAWKFWTYTLRIIAVPAAIITPTAIASDVPSWIAVAAAITAAVAASFEAIYQCSARWRMYRVARDGLFMAGWDFVVESMRQPDHAPIFRRLTTKVELVMERSVEEYSEVVLPQVNRRDDEGPSDRDSSTPDTPSG
jgi:hypothetical protein